MALFYRLYKNNNSHSKGYGKWYARPVVTDTVGIEQIAERMQANCTVKRADILAVLSELGPVVKDMLQQSLRVQIPYLGCFKLSMSSTGEAEKEKWNPLTCFKKARIIFQPVHTIDKTTRARSYEMLQGLTLKDAEYLGVKKPSTSDTTSGDTGDTGDGETGRP